MNLIRCSSDESYCSAGNIIIDMCMSRFKRCRHTHTGTISIQRTTESLHCLAACLPHVHGSRYKSIHTSWGQNPLPKGVRFMQFNELTDSMLTHLIMTEQVLVGKFALTSSC